MAIIGNIPYFQTKPCHGDVFSPIYRRWPWCAPKWLELPSSGRWTWVSTMGLVVTFPPLVNHKSLAGPIPSCLIEIPILLLKNIMSFLGWTQICLTGTLYIFGCLRIKYSTRIPFSCAHFSHRSSMFGGEKFKSEINQVPSGKLT